MSKQSLKEFTEELLEISEEQSFQELREFRRNNESPNYTKYLTQKPPKKTKTKNINKKF